MNEFPDARPSSAAFNWQDFDTSRWQLMIERYINFPCLCKEGRMAACGRYCCKKILGVRESSIDSRSARDTQG
jgi:hypothetical protein